MVVSKKIVSFALCLFLSLCAAFADDAQVMAVTGKAEVQKGSDWVALAVGDKVPKGAVISTGFKSELLLKVNSSNIKMGPLTRLTVEQLVQSSSANKTSLFIDSGKVNVEVNKTEGKREDFKVSSPIATASVRGTAFTLFADGTLATHSGLVSKSASTSKKPRVSTAEEDAAFIAEFGEIEDDKESAESSEESSEVATSETDEEEEEAEEATEEESEGEESEGEKEASSEEAVSESTEIAEVETTDSSSEESVTESTEKVAVVEVAVKEEKSAQKEAKVSVFTSSFADGGTPVFAGQSSKTDFFTGQQTSAQTAAAQSASISSSGTTSLASQESVSTAPAVSSSSSATNPVAENEPPVARKPTLTVTVNFPK